MPAEVEPSSVSGCCCYHLAKHSGVPSLAAGRDVESLSSNVRSPFLLKEKEITL